MACCAIMAALPGFEVASSEFGTQNFLRRGWGDFTEAEITSLLRYLDPNADGDLSCAEVTSISPSQSFARRAA